MGDHRERYERDVVTVHGLKIDLRTSEQPGHQQLIFSLESEQNADLFAVLCQSLLAELLGAKSAGASLDIALNHLRRWKAFLANRHARLLTNEEIRGLFAELWFFIELTKTKLGSDAAVDAWHGPDKVQQDFIFGGSAVEVKSLVSVDPRTVRISSENQLESGEPRLYLVVVLLTETKTESGRSLNGIVNEAVALVAGSDAQFQLESKLAQFGYVPLAEYERPVFEVTATTAYEVTGDFPRIARSSLPAGVVRVAYQIQLEHLMPFECDMSAALGGS